MLVDFKMPKGQLNDRTAYTLISLCRVKEDDSWSDASISYQRTVDLMEFMDTEYGKKYKPNSRETIRRFSLHQLMQAGIVEWNADDLGRPTNGPGSTYSLTPEALELIKQYGADNWDELVEQHFIKYVGLAEEYQMKRDVNRIPLMIDGVEFFLSPGKHNLLQKKIIDDFAAIFAQGSKLLYVGDTAKKDLYIDVDKLQDIGISITQHDKLPDVVLYNEEKNWIYLCEAVTSHGPVSPKRYKELEEMLVECKSGRIYVSCFLTMSDFKKYAEDIVWESEVWVADMPTHMLHYNGDRFMGPR